jgi:hypothetical protein
VLFPILEAIHVMGLALMVGTIAIVDVRVLGRHPLGTLASELAPWTWAGFALMLITGALLFFSNAARYVRNPGFLVKMGFLVLALIVHCTAHRKSTRFAALLSLVLWSCVVISARFIADLDI